MDHLNFESKKFLPNGLVSLVTGDKLIIGSEGRTQEEYVFAERKSDQYTFAIRRSSEQIDALSFVRQAEGSNKHTGIVIASDIDESTYMRDTGSKIYRETFRRLDTALQLAETNPAIQIAQTISH